MRYFVLGLVKGSGISGWFESYPLKVILYRRK
jgi:hypothetical protein